MKTSSARDETKPVLESASPVVVAPAIELDRGSSGRGIKVPHSGLLIVNADDWGRDQENTDRTLDCISGGTVSSVSAMVYMEDSARAATVAKARGIDAGLHLNFTTPFSGSQVPTRLIEHQERLSRCLLRHRFAAAVFYPWLAKSFEYVVSAQIDEFHRLYGAKPERLDGHHHMHLCSNVVLGNLLPEGSIVRRNFTFQPGEKSLGNRWYRKFVDALLARRYRLVDCFFALEPLRPDRLQRIFSVAGESIVELETHPINADEYRFLLSGDILRGSGDVPIASCFPRLRFAGSASYPESGNVGFEISQNPPVETKEEVKKAFSPAPIGRISNRPQTSGVTVLVGFAEAATAAEVAWSLVDEGCEVIAFARKGRASALRYSRHVVCRDICAPESNLEAAVSDLRDLLISIQANTNDRLVLFPLDDKAVWLCSRAQIGGDWVLAGPDGEQAGLALNKYAQIQQAAAAGFNVPKTVLARTANDIRSFIAEESYPVILKSSQCVLIEQGRARSCPHWICANDAELKRAVEEWGERTPLLVQPFILGVGEGIFGLAAPGGIRAWSAHRRLRMMNPQGSGSSACISQLVSEDLRSHVEEFVKRAGWRGMFMVELLRDHSGKVFFVEFNGRPWGSMALSRRQHLEYPAWQVMLAVDANSQAGKVAAAAPGMVSRHAGRELMHLLFVLRGPKSQALSDWPSVWKSATGMFCFRKGQTLYNWRREDWKVFVADVCYTIQSNLFKNTN